MTRAGILAGCIVCTLGIGALVACGGGAPSAVAAKATEAPGGSHDPSKWPADDRSLCEGFLHWKNNPAYDADVMVGADAIRPNIRRIYKTVGERDSRRSVLLCREADTNLDGLKDIVRTFNEKGEPIHEEADTNFDGKIDDWVNFSGGRISEEDVDTTYAKGRPNVWKFFVDGQLSRIRRNSHCASGNPDIWEIYFNNRLERVGVDNTCDGHVDRWDRDAQLMASEESAQQGGTDGGAASAADAGPECDPSAGPCAADGGGAASTGRAAKKK
jgi:hypothetical protein